MMEQTPKTPDLIDTTDCLEAINSIRGMKNFFFWIVLICLLITQGVFWLNQTGRVEKACVSCAGSCKTQIAFSSIQREKVDAKPVAEAKTHEKDKEPIRVIAEDIGQTLSLGSKTQPKDPNSGISVQNQPASETKKDSGSKVEQELPEMKGIPKAESMPVTEQTDAKQDKKLPWFLGFFDTQFSCACMGMTIKACNFVLIFAATMHCLMMLMSLKISLTGRLGGIKHISKAFFVSMFALVIMLPWQVLLPGVVTGAIYLPDELFSYWNAKVDLSFSWLVLYYLRFVGLWLVVLWLFIWSQSRSAKWANATLRRLGLVR